MMQRMIYLLASTIQTIQVFCMQMSKKYNLNEEVL
jgi:hypothetical protein